MQLLQIASDDPGECARAILETIPKVFQFIRQTAHHRRAKGLSVQQFRALGFLHHRPECSLSMVAEFLGLSLPATSRLIDCMVRKNLVRRIIPPANRRQVHLTSTAPGRRLLAGTVQWTRQQIAERVATLPAKRRHRILSAIDDLELLFGTDFCGVSPDHVQSSH